MRKDSGKAFLITILVLLLITVSVSFFTYNFRLVKTTGGIHVVEKAQPAFDTPYVDITKWGLKEMFVFRQITGEVIDAGYGPEPPYVAAFKHAFNQGVVSVKEFDERYGISQSVADGYEWSIDQMKEMDQQYELSQKMEAMKNRARELDEQYQISKG